MLLPEAKLIDISCEVLTDSMQNEDTVNSFPWRIRCTYAGPVDEDGTSPSSTAHVDPIVDHIVLAEFDINTGSTVRHQYPDVIPCCTADWLAENMLPEGVHNRSEDWTYMFLNRSAPRVDQREVTDLDDDCVYVHACHASYHSRNYLLPAPTPIAIRRKRFHHSRCRLWYWYWHRHPCTIINIGSSLLPLRHQSCAQ